MPKVRARAAERWARRAAAAVQDYASGVQDPRTPWKAATSASAATYTAAVQQSLSEKRWERAIAQTTEETWQRAAVAKGQSRYPEGVSQAQTTYESAVQPYLQTIEATKLPPRGPKGDPRNLDRVRAIAQALRNAKLARLAGRAASLAILITTIITAAGCATSFTANADLNPPNQPTTPN